MNKYYVGQKLLCIKSHKLWGISEGLLCNIIREKDGCFELSSLIPTFGIHGDRNNQFWAKCHLNTFFVDATKHVSEQEFNSKFDDWINNE